MKKIIVTTFASLMLLAVGAKQTDPSKVPGRTNTVSTVKQQPVAAKVETTKPVQHTAEYNKRAAERANRNTVNPAWQAKLAANKKK